MNRITDRPMNLMMRSRMPRVLVVGSFLFLLTAPLAGAAPPPDGALRRAFSVEVTGSGPAMILIPGLASGGNIWHETVEHYKGRYTCHVLTLAGFAGVPALGETAFLERVRNDLAAYIREQELNRPVVVGHSLGGFLALWLAAAEPDLVGPFVVVDGLPYLAAAQMPNATPEMMQPQAEQMRAMMAAQTQEQFRQSQAQILPTMISDAADVALALATGGASDPKAVAQATYELFTIDLRDDLTRIRVPALVVGTWVGYQPFATREQVEKTFETQYAALKGVRILLHDSARHFIMYDDPAGLHREIDAFLSVQ